MKESRSSGQVTALKRQLDGPRWSAIVIVSWMLFAALPARGLAQAASDGRQDGRNDRLVQRAQKHGKQDAEHDGADGGRLQCRRVINRAHPARAATCAERR